MNLFIVLFKAWLIQEMRFVSCKLLLILNTDGTSKLFSVSGTGWEMIRPVGGLGVKIMDAVFVLIVL